MKNTSDSESGLALSNRIQSIHCLFGSDERLLYFLFHHKKTELREPPEDLIKEARSLSCGEQLLIRAAIDIWCGQGNAKLADLLSSLDDTNLLRLLMAMAKIRGLIELEEVLQCYTL